MKVGGNGECSRRTAYGNWDKFQFNVRGLFLAGGEGAYGSISAGGGRNDSVTCHLHALSHAFDPANNDATAINEMRWEVVILTCKECSVRQGSRTSKDCPARLKLGMGAKMPGIEQYPPQLQASSGDSHKIIKHLESPQNITSKSGPCKQNIIWCQGIVQKNYQR